jgi:hypothetical protein
LLSTSLRISGEENLVAGEHTLQSLQMMRGIDARKTAAWKDESLSPRLFGWD